MPFLFIFYMEDHKKKREKYAGRATISKPNVLKQQDTAPINS